MDENSKRGKNLIHSNCNKKKQNKWQTEMKNRAGFGLSQTRFVVVYESNR